MSHLPGKPVIALDIDGTTGNYHDHFHWFAQMYLGRELSLDWDPVFQGSFNRALHITKRTYRDVKLAYRQGGMKRCMPVKPGVRELTVELRRAGAEVWVCTTRPYLRLDNIDPDTRHWLDHRARMQYDGVLYGEDKYKDLSKIVGAENVVAVLDDLPEQTEKAQRVGLKAIMADGNHNYWYQAQQEINVWNGNVAVGIDHVKSPELNHVSIPIVRKRDCFGQDARCILMNLLNDWKKNNGR